jgi:hypothetical protein
VKSLTLTQEASQKEQEEAGKMVRQQNSPRRSSTMKISAKNVSKSPGPTLKKAKNKHTFTCNCFFYSGLPGIM